MTTKGGPVFTFSLPGGMAQPPCPPSVTPLTIGRKYCCGMTWLRIEHRLPCLLVRIQTTRPLCPHYYINFLKVLRQSCRSLQRNATELPTCTTYKCLHVSVI